VHPRKVTKIKNFLLFGTILDVGDIQHNLKSPIPAHAGSILNQKKLKNLENNISVRCTLGYPRCFSFYYKYYADLPLKTQFLTNMLQIEETVKMQSTVILKAWIFANNDQKRGDYSFIN